MRRQIHGRSSFPDRPPPPQCGNHPAVSIRTRLRKPSQYCRRSGSSDQYRHFYIAPPLPAHRSATGPKSRQNRQMPFPAQFHPGGMHNYQVPAYRGAQTPEPAPPCAETHGSPLPPFLSPLRTQNTGKEFFQDCLSYRYGLPLPLSERTSYFLFRKKTGKHTEVPLRNGTPDTPPRFYEPLPAERTPSDCR